MDFDGVGAAWCEVIASLAARETQTRGRREAGGRRAGVARRFAWQLAAAATKAGLIRRSCSEGLRAGGQAA